MTDKVGTVSLVKLKDVDLTVGAFTGRLRVRSTNALKLCDVCGKDAAMWQHLTKKGARKVYLCFGCGDH